MQIQHVLPLCRAQGLLNPGRKEGEEDVEQKMNKNLQDKVQKVAEITEKLKSAKSMVMVDYKGITVEEINALRGKFREAGVEYVVLKNTLVRRAMEEAGIKELDHLLVGPSALPLASRMRWDRPRLSWTSSSRARPRR